MTAVLSRLARCIRDGSDGEKNAAWVQLAADNGTGIAHDIWAMAKREADDTEDPVEPVQEELW